MVEVFITFACYGARLHGDESGSVDRRHNLVGSRLLEPDAQLLAAIQGHCAYRGWKLLAAHVRSNHVHTIVEAETRPENPIGNAGRGMEAPVGCGRTRMSGMLFST